MSDEVNLDGTIEEAWLTSPFCKIAMKNKQYYALFRDIFYGGAVTAYVAIGQCEDEAAYAAITKEVLEYSSQRASGVKEPDIGHAVRKAH